MVAVVAAVAAAAAVVVAVAVAVAVLTHDQSLLRVRNCQQPRTPGTLPLHLQGLGKD